MQPKLMENMHRVPPWDPRLFAGFGKTQLFTIVVFLAPLEMQTARVTNSL